MYFRRNEINTLVFLANLSFSYKVFYHISNLLVVRTSEGHPGISKGEKGEKLVMKQEKRVDILKESFFLLFATE